MKIRIQDNSVRFRLTLREVETLRQDGVITRHTEIPGTDGGFSLFRYSINARTAADESWVQFLGDGFTLHLSSADLEMLSREDQEGVYLRRSWIGRDGAEHRFLAFVEKDRPGSTCVKKEQWIYDAPPHGEVILRPIPRRKVPT